MEDIMVLDDVMPASYSIFLEEALLNSIHNWHFNGSTNEDFISSSNLIYEQFQFVFKPVDKFNNIFNKEYFHFISIPLSLFALKNKFYFDASKHLLRCKLNLQTQSPKINKEKFNYPHTDYHPTSDKLLTILYYVNDSDGDTYFFKEKFKRNMSKEEIDNLTLIKQVSPKRGRLVVFRGDIMHAGSHPVNHSTRVVINYNLLLP